MPHSATLASGKPVCRAAAASAVDGGGAAAGGGGEQRWRRRRRRRPWPWLGRPGGECADTCVACRVTTRVRCQLESVTGSRGGQVYLPAVRLLSRAPSRNLILSLFAALFDFAHVLGFLRRASDSQCIHPSPRRLQRPPLFATSPPRLHPTFSVQQTRSSLAKSSWIGRMMLHSMGSLYGIPPHATPPPFA